MNKDQSRGAGGASPKRNEGDESSLFLLPHVTKCWPVPVPILHEVLPTGTVPPASGAQEVGRRGPRRSERKAPLGKTRGWGSFCSPGAVSGTSLFTTSRADLGNAPAGSIQMQMALFKW